jgi:hypothetical protein
MTYTVYGTTEISTGKNIAILKHVNKCDFAAAPTRRRRHAISRGAAGG